MPDPVCRYEFDGTRCRKRGNHLCNGRVGHALAFFNECLVHAKGEWAGRPFIPAAWQREKVLKPLFGTVFYDVKRQKYVRQYRLLYLCCARKNGKSELIAGLVLYMLIADGEYGAEIYGLASDRDQAGLVYNVCRLMIKLSPALRDRLTVMRHNWRIVDEDTGSFFAVVAAGALGNLGANPSAGYIDELLAQPNRDLYDVLRTGLGARAQPLIMLATTAEADESGFAATERMWSERVAEDQSLEPERLSVIYTAPPEDDWRDPKTWLKANPAMGDFLDTQVLARECHSAQGNPVEERSFRQFRLNQPVRSVGRAINVPSWDASAGSLSEGGLSELAEALNGKRCFGGLDIGATSDIASYAFVFPNESSVDVFWRYFLPAAALSDFNRRTSALAETWVSQGWLTITEGNVLDYSAIKHALERDRERFEIVDLAFDRWQAVQLQTEMVEEDWKIVNMGQGFGSMAGPTAELLRLVGLGLFHHHGNPIARWEAGNAVTRTDTAGAVRFDKSKSMERIDGIVASVRALDRMLRQEAPPSFATLGFG
jgi:phage terminase large subunit-like protein